jgi:glycerophosphoryl diester phosphodiesterase
MRFFEIVFLVFVLPLTFVSCGNVHEKIEDEKKEPMQSKEIDIQGHRGCRGLYPENTIPGFIHALDLGVHTLEMDVVITKDSLVLCSHEPWFSHEIALTPDGGEISQEEELNHRIYDLNYSETQAYDCGSKPHPRFPDQIKMKINKPLLSAVIDSAEAHSKKTGRPLPFYNIETKSRPEGDGTFHPDPATFSELLIQVLIEKGIEDRSIIQSFDPRTLQYIHARYPDFALALLVENNDDPAEMIANLGFIPAIYSPDYNLVDKSLISFCEEKKMKCIPWTVNTVEESKVLINFGVDGIITDYPDRIVPLTQ